MLSAKVFIRNDVCLLCTWLGDTFRPREQGIVSETRLLAWITVLKPIPEFVHLNVTAPNRKSDTVFAANRINEATFKAEIGKIDELRSFTTGKHDVSDDRLGHACVI